MRKQTKVPPPPAPAPEPEEDVGELSLIHTLGNMLPPGIPITPDQLECMGEMLLALSYRKQVQIDWWMELLSEVQRMVSLSEACKAESRLLRALDPPEDKKAALMGAIELSAQEISGLRKKLHARYEALVQMPRRGTTIN